MKRALISDIHANSEALQKVLEDIRQQGVTEIYCLGDIIGYGPNPCECLDQVMQHCAVTILGNHDQAALFDPDGFNPVALQAVYWTREQLERRDINAQVADARWDLPGRAATFVQRGRLPVRAWFAARADQRVRVPGRRLQPAEDGCVGSIASSGTVSRATRTFRACSRRAASSSRRTSATTRIG